MRSHTEQRLNLQDRSAAGYPASAAMAAMATTTPLECRAREAQVQSAKVQQPSSALAAAGGTPLTLALVYQVEQVNMKLE